MHEDTEENILCSGVEHTFLSLVSPKIKVLIIGGGKAAVIKAKTFSKKGCSLTIVAQNFNEDFRELRLCKNISFVLGEYDRKYIDAHHLVVIATKSEELNYEIRKHCDERFKLYIDAANPEESLCITPSQRSTETVEFALHTKVISPKTSVYLCDKTKKYLEEYNDFVKFTGNLRNSIKELEKKRDIMNFVCSEDFYFFHLKGKAEIVLRLFYEELY